MKILSWVCVLIALASLITGIVSRMTMMPIAHVGLESRAFIGFTAVMLLFSIALSLLKKD